MLLFPLGLTIRDNTHDAVLIVDTQNRPLFSFPYIDVQTRLTAILRAEFVWAAVDYFQSGGYQKERDDLLRLRAKGGDPQNILNDLQAQRYDLRAFLLQVEQAIPSAESYEVQPTNIANLRSELTRLKSLYDIRYTGR
ncbi:MAG: hypothetical protein H7145_12660 [Akkermansiaceae bacterium]|nr:hypothetical protein [Armatimonadota bacterium]